MSTTSIRDRLVTAFSLPAVFKGEDLKFIYPNNVAAAAPIEYSLYDQYTNSNSYTVKDSMIAHIMIEANLFICNLQNKIEALQTVTGKPTFKEVLARFQLLKVFQSDTDTSPVNLVSLTYNNLTQLVHLFTTDQIPFRREICSDFLVKLRLHDTICTHRLLKFIACLYQDPELFYILSLSEAIGMNNVKFVEMFLGSDCATKSVVERAMAIAIHNHKNVFDCSGYPFQTLILVLQYLQDQRFNFPVDPINVSTSLYSTVQYCKENHINPYNLLTRFFANSHTGDIEIQPSVCQYLALYNEAFQLDKFKSVTKLVDIYKNLNNKDWTQFDDPMIHLHLYNRIAFANATHEEMYQPKHFKDIHLFMFLFRYVWYLDVNKLPLLFRKSKKDRQLLLQTIQNTKQYTQYDAILILSEVPAQLTSHIYHFIYGYPPITHMVASRLQSIDNDT